MSGTLAGQELAWSLLVPAATLGVIGFTMDKPQIRLSNLMALDATAFGSWGCSPSLYRRRARDGGVRTGDAPAVHRAASARRRTGAVRAAGRFARRRRPARHSRSHRRLEAL